MLPLFDAALQLIQAKLIDELQMEEHLTKKRFVTARISCTGINISEILMTKIPLSEDIGKLIGLRGTIIRTG